MYKRELESLLQDRSSVLTKREHDKYDLRVLMSKVRDELFIKCPHMESSGITACCK